MWNAVVLFDAVHFHRFIQRAWNWVSMLTSADTLALVFLVHRATMSSMLRHLPIGALIWWSLMAATLMLLVSIMVSPFWLHCALLSEDISIDCWAFWWFLTFFFHHYGFRFAWLAFASLILFVWHFAYMLKQYIYLICCKQFNCSHNHYYDGRWFVMYSFIISDLTVAMFPNPIISKYLL